MMLEQKPVESMCALKILNITESFHEQQGENDKSFNK